MIFPMPRSTVHCTYALDRETVDALDRLADRWGSSSSAALRRIIRAAAAVEEVDAMSDSLTALDDLQEHLGLTEERAEVWARRIREERVAAGS